MRWWAALNATLALLVASVILQTITKLPFVLLMVLATALWAAFDSSKIHLKRYKSGISNGPVVIFFGVILLWIAAFPWFLIVRGKIKAGTATLKEGFRVSPSDERVDAV